MQDGPLAHAGLAILGRLPAHLHVIYHIQSLVNYGDIIVSHQNFAAIFFYVSQGNILSLQLSKCCVKTDQVR